MVKYKITELYSANITEEKILDFALASKFISKSNQEFIFAKEGNIYKEVFTEVEFTDIVDNVSDATNSKTLISPKPLRVSYFKKEQRKDGEVSQSHIIPVYRKINEPKKQLIKVRAA